MTSKQVSELCNGDTFDARFEVLDISVDGTLIYTMGGGIVPVDAVVSIIPRPLEAEDRVKYYEYDIGTILYVFEKWALVKWDKHPMPEVHYISDLQRVKEEEKPDGSQ